MAFRKITEGDMLGKGNVGRPDTPGVSTAEMQRIMDELPREVLAPAFNELAGQLEAETAAADIGAAAPEGVTAAPAGKLQAVLNGLRDLVKAHTDRADNPHGVTAAQAGAYSKAETDAAISAKVVELGAGDMAKSIYDPGNEQQPLLPRNGDGSNVTASFTEAEQDADIQTGEELTVLFGKIKKRFSTSLSVVKHGNTQVWKRAPEYLYNNGDQCSGFTGGWDARAAYFLNTDTYYRNQTGTKPVFNTGNISVTCTGSYLGGGSVITNWPVDLSTVSSLTASINKFDPTETYSAFNIYLLSAWPTINADNSYVAAVRVLGNQQATSVTLNTSGYNGSYYI